MGFGSIDGFSVPKSAYPQATGNNGGTLHRNQATTLSRRATAPSTRVRHPPGSQPPKKSTVDYSKGGAGVLLDLSFGTPQTSTVDGQTSTLNSSSPVTNFTGTKFADRVTVTALPDARTLDGGAQEAGQQDELIFDAEGLAVTVSTAASQLRQAARLLHALREGKVINSAVSSRSRAPPPPTRFGSRRPAMISNT
jgi:hypothetical protein